MDIYDFMSKRITKLRAGKAASIISSELGKGATYINQIELNRKKPPLQSILQICNYFGITLAEFFKTEEDEKDLPEKVERAREQMKTMHPEDLENLIRLMSKLPKRKRPR